MKLKNPPPDYYKTVTYEGLMYRMNRVLKRNDAKIHWKKLEPLVTQGVCPECHGARMNPTILSCRIGGKNIEEVTSMPMGDIFHWMDESDDPVAVDMVASLRDESRP